MEVITLSRDYYIGKIEMDFEKPELVVYLRTPGSQDIKIPQSGQQVGQILEMINKGNFTQRSLRKAILERINSSGVVNGTISDKEFPPPQQPPEQP